MSERSIVEYLAEHEGYSCGYCKSTNTSFSHGMWGHTLTPQDYQDLVNRGWRRSGKYCYKPLLSMTCCPQYAIRCEALKFRLSKSHKKVLKRMHKFLENGDKQKNSSDTCDRDVESDYQPMEFSDRIHLSNDQYMNEISKLHKDTPGEWSNESSETLESSMNSGVESSSVLHTSVDVERTDIKSHGVSAGPDPSRPPCRKAKDIRRERRLQKLLKSGISEKEAHQLIAKKNPCPEKSLEDLLFEPFSKEPAHKLVLRLLPSDLKNSLFCETYDESYSVYQKYQFIIHNDSPEKCTQKQYTRFLVNSPLQYLNNVYGSFHQQYWLDDKLIAVGVLDILPHCVSSVYLYYDPDYGFLSLGTYAALREIALVRELSKAHTDLKYYYMGFYIHSCPKMRYKGQYFPSYLLCPETYVFQPIEKCISKLDISKYHRLEEDPKKDDTDGVVHLKEVMLLYQRQAMTYLTYIHLKNSTDDEDEIQQYAKLVGRKCYRHILLYRN